MEPWDGPAVDRLHRRHAHRRRARSQRPAPVALLRHERRPRHHGVGSGRARHPRRSRRACKDRLRPGKMLLVDTGQGRIISDEEIKRDARRRTSLRRVAAPAPGGHRGPAERARGAARSPDGAPAAAGVRLHAGGPARAPHADGPQRRGAARLDGHRHGARGAVGQAAAALRLLHAALRAGDQPAARRDPRGAGHVDGLDARPRGQPARGRRRRRAGRSRSTTRSCTTIRWPSCATCRRARRSARRPCRCSTTRTRTARASSARWTSSAARRARPWPRATAS